MRIFITGDCHGNQELSWHPKHRHWITSVRKLNSDNFPEGKALTKDDIVIVLGDFGLVFYEKDTSGYYEEQWWLNWLDSKPWTTVFIDGNHENFNLLNDYPIHEYMGGKVSFITNSIIHLKRGEVFTFNGKTFLTIGGAESVDKHTRTENLSWWPQELLSREDENKVLDLIEKNNKFDYVLTHTSPQSVNQLIAETVGLEHHTEHWSFFEDPTVRFLQHVKRNITYKRWFSGHFHKDVSFGKHTFLFKTVMEL